MDPKTAHELDPCREAAAGDEAVGGLDHVPVGTVDQPCDANGREESDQYQNQKFCMKDSNNLTFRTKLVYLHVKVVRDMAQTGVSVSWNVSWVTEARFHGHSRCIHVGTIGARQMTELTKKTCKIEYRSFLLHVNAFGY